MASPSVEGAKLGEPLAGAAEVCLDDLDLDVEAPLGDMPLPPVDWPLPGGAAPIDSFVHRTLEDFDATDTTDALPVVSLAEAVSFDIGDLPTGVRPAPRPPGAVDDLAAAPEALSDATDALPVMSLPEDVSFDISDLPTGVRPMPRPPGGVSDLPTGARPRPAAPEALSDVTDVLPPLERALPIDEDISDLPTGVRPMPRPPGDINDLPTGVRPRPARPGALSDATDVLPPLEPALPADEDISDLPTGVRPMPSPPGRAGERETTRMRAPRPRKG